MRCCPPPNLVNRPTPVENKIPQALHNSAPTQDYKCSIWWLTNSSTGSYHLFKTSHRCSCFFLTSWLISVYPLQDHTSYSWHPIVHKIRSSPLVPRDQSLKHSSIFLIKGSNYSPEAQKALSLYLLCGQVLGTRCYVLPGRYQYDYLPRQRSRS